VTAADLDAWIPQLAGLRATKRAKLQGVSHSRSRQILAGAVVARATMKALNVDSVDVCPWALREGIVLHYLLTTHHGSFDLPLRPLAGTGYQPNGQVPQAAKHLAIATANAQAQGDRGAGRPEQEASAPAPIAVS
jgi:exopolyphosphatase/pppGpp-phosphohydrolase